MPRGAKPKTYPAELVARVRELYESGMTQDEVAVLLGTTQRVIWRLMLRHGIPRRPRVKRNQVGAQNASWKGGRHVTPRGYVMVLRPEHPRAHRRTGYVFEHILVAEEMLGRPLEWYGHRDPRSEIVHHKDDNRQNNVPSNLEVHSFASHLAEHRDALGRNGGAREVSHA